MQELLIKISKKIDNIESILIGIAGGLLAGLIVIVILLAWIASRA